MYGMYFYWKVAAPEDIIIYWRRVLATMVLYPICSFRRIVSFQFSPTPGQSILYLYLAERRHGK